MTMITPSAQLTLTKGNKSWSSTAVAAALEWSAVVCPGFWRVRFERRGEKSGIYIASRCPGQKPVGETAASGTGRSEVIKVISRNGLSLRELPEALDAVGAFSTAGEGVIS